MQISDSVFYNLVEYLCIFPCNQNKDLCIFESALVYFMLLRTTQILSIIKYIKHNDIKFTKHVMEIFLTFGKHH